VAYAEQNETSIDGIQGTSEWADTRIYIEPISGVEVAFKHNGTGLFVQFRWREDSPRDSIYVAIEFDNNGDQAHMGSSASPDDMIMVSASFDGFVKEGFSTGTQLALFNEEIGGATYAVAALRYSDGRYVVEFYRPFTTNNTVGYDVQLRVGLTLGVGFAVGDFSARGSHRATDMMSYSLNLVEGVYAGGEEPGETPPAEQGPLVVHRMALSPEQAFIASALLFVGLFMALAYVGARYKMGRAWKP
jgi:hypothetical protein